MKVYYIRVRAFDGVSVSAGRVLDALRESLDSSREQQEFFEMITESKFSFASTPWSIFSLLNLIGQVYETSVLEFPYGEQITLLTQVIKPNIRFHLPTDQHFHYLKLAVNGH